MALIIHLRNDLTSKLHLSLQLRSYTLETNSLMLIYSRALWFIIELYVLSCLLCIDYVIIFIVIRTVLTMEVQKLHILLLLYERMHAVVNDKMDILHSACHEEMTESVV